MKRSLSISALIAVAIVGLATTSIYAIDTIVLKNKKTHEGRFEGYKNGRFYFITSAGKKLHEQKTKVVSLEVDPPSRVELKTRGKSKNEDYRLKGFANRKFKFEKGSKDVEMDSMKVTIVKMVLDFSRTADAVKSTGKTISEGEEVSIESNLVDDVATVVHFHKADVGASVRQGSYVEVKARDSRGKLRLIKIVMPDWGCDVAKQYKIESAPQFWFYNKSGKLSGKLVDRFTEPDIDRASKKAMKKK